MDTWWLRPRVTNQPISTQPGRHFASVAGMWCVWCWHVRVEDGLWNEWQEKLGWKAGANFIPSTAVNVLEMWQATTYDIVTIDRELQFAENFGFGIIRVFLHNLLWEQDSTGFLHRIGDFLTCAASHKLSVMFVFFDSCWLSDPQLGTQPEPIYGVHNSHWVQAPGADYIAGLNGKSFNSQQEYVTGIVSRYKEDTRIMAWDIWNEPNNNSDYDGSETIAPLLEKVR